MRPLTPLINYSSKLLFYHNDRYTSFPAHNFHQASIHPPPSKKTRVKYLLFPFMIVILVKHTNKRTRLLLSDSYPLNTYTVIKPSVICHVLSGIHITTTQTLPSRLQNHARYLSPIVQRKHSYYTKKLLPPIINNIPSIIIHTSTQPRERRE